MRWSPTPRGISDGACLDTSGAGQAQVLRVRLRGDAAVGLVGQGGIDIDPLTVPHHSDGPRAERRRQRSIRIGPGRGRLGAAFQHLHLAPARLSHTDGGPGVFASVMVPLASAWVCAADVEGVSPLSARAGVAGPIRASAVSADNPLNAVARKGIRLEGRPREVRAACGWCMCLVCQAYDSGAEANRIVPGTRAAVVVPVPRGKYVAQCGEVLGFSGKN